MNAVDLLDENVKTDPENSFLWEVPLREICRMMASTPSESEREKGNFGIEDALSVLERSGKNKWKPHPFRSDLEYLAKDGLLVTRDPLVMRDAKTKKPVAGFYYSARVADGYAGKGYGAEMLFLRTMRGGRNVIGGLTSWGFRAARSAHRLNVERALAAGLDVPDRVLSDYTVLGDRLCLMRPWDADEAQALYHRSEILTRHLDYQEICASHEEVTMPFEEFVAFCQDYDEHWGVRGLPEVLDQTAGTLLTAEINNRVLGVYMKTDHGYISPFGLVGDYLPDRHILDMLEEGTRTTRIESGGFFFEKVPVEDPFAPVIFNEINLNNPDREELPLNQELVCDAIEREMRHPASTSDGSHLFNAIQRKAARACAELSAPAL